MPTMFREHRPEPHKERELTLCEMLDDPIVAHVMRRDGVARSDVTRLLRLANENVFVDPTGERIEGGPENTGPDDRDGQLNFATRSPSHD